MTQVTEMSLQDWGFCRWKFIKVLESHPACIADYNPMIGTLQKGLFWHNNTYCTLSKIVNVELLLKVESF